MIIKNIQQIINRWISCFIVQFWRPKIILNRIASLSICLWPLRVSTIHADAWFPEQPQMGHVIGWKPKSQYFGFLLEEWRCTEETRKYNRNEWGVTQYLCWWGSRVAITRKRRFIFLNAFARNSWFFSRFEETNGLDRFKDYCKKKKKECHGFWTLLLVKYGLFTFFAFICKRFGQIQSVKEKEPIIIIKGTKSTVM